MSDPARACPIELGELVDYLLHELPAEEANRLEEHFFECHDCSERLATVDRIAVSIARAVRQGSVEANVTEAFVGRVLRDGFSVREYRIPSGEMVSCAAGPEDFTVVRLEADYPERSDLELEVAFHDLETDQTAPALLRPVVADPRRGEVVLVFPGETVRSYPRSRWTLRVLGSSAEGPMEFGPFVMDHTP